MGKDRCKLNSKHNTSNFSQPEWMLCVMYSMTICIHPVLFVISYIWRIMEYHSVFWYGSCVRCGHSCCIILIPKQLIQLRPQWFSPKKISKPWKYELPIFFNKPQQTNQLSPYQAEKSSSMHWSSSPSPTFTRRLPPANKIKNYIGKRNKLIKTIFKDALIFA